MGLEKEISDIFAKSEFSDQYIYWLFVLFNKTIKKPKPLRAQEEGVLRWVLLNFIVFMEVFGEIDIFFVEEIDQFIGG